MATNTTSNHGTLIKDQVSTMLVQPLEAASIVLASGPTIFPSSEPVRVPRLDSSGDVTWVGEGELIPDNYTAGFSEIPLMPKERKSLKVICRFTNELIRMAAIGVSPIMQQRIVTDVKNKLDDALLVGDGSDNTITGIFNQPGTQKGALDLSKPDSLLDALALTTAKEVTPNRWFINAGDFFTLRKVKDGNGRYILTEDITSDTTYKLFGIPVTVSNKVPAGKAALLDMKQVAVVRDVDPAITILNERYAEYDEVGIRVVTRYDLGLLNPKGVVILEAAGA
ncbi:phage major capsid protein [Corynebacterium epidermidicanis]|uniref:Phage major capsid protein, HK97 family n=1 Tax=Corynebacterium epidermidicanis TaxID=1050174 RepID=A0A0G3GM76_9CORY|nr:phage major capsid protein [Corynebacterium epidermidicanis]AKK02336.1 phage major capsid protein, HK97 family [Corynebacterium epidermidicanis]